MRAREGRLDLMNHRFFYKNENPRVYDSCEDTEHPGRVRLKGSLKYSHQTGREMYKPPEIYHSNEIVNPPGKNCRGEYVTCVDTILHSPLKSVVTERLNNTFELQNNDAAMVFHTATRLNKLTKEGIGTGASEVESRIWKDIQAGNVHGGQWSASTTSRKPLMEIPTQLGPGDYDVTRWERSQFGPQPSSAVKFNDIETNRLELKLIPEGQRCPSPTTYFVDSSPLPPLGSSPRSFPHDKRFRMSAPKYLKTSGLTLSHDFDRREGWREGLSPVKMASQSSPRPKTDPGYQFGVDFINPDTGSKVTIKTEVEQSPMRYSKSFKSKAAPGLLIPPSQSGQAGPGEYRGACDKSCIEIKLPNNSSAAFLAHRELDPPVMSDKYDTLRPRFHRSKETKTDEYLSLNATTSAKSLPTPVVARIGKIRRRRRHPTGRVSTTTESEEMKLSHIALWTKTKMTRIYPRLAKDKFGN